jgi:transcriptional regulator with XRE-family HTH domain
MNRLREIRKEKEKTIVEIAKTLGLDEATLFLFELQGGLIHIDVALSVCSLLDVSFFEMFPELEDLGPPEQDEEDDEITLVFNLLDNAENRVRFYATGIDPDSRNWFARVGLKSGVERRYRLSSIEKSYLEDSLLTEEKANPYIVFHADCQTVILRRDSVLDARFSNALSYAQFSTEENAFRVTIVMENMPLPRSVEITIDDPSDNGHGRPLAALIEKAREGGQLPSFLRFPRDQEDCLVNIEHMELLEIPVGLTIPYLYLDEMELEDIDFDEHSLSFMEPQGTA